MGAPKYRKVYGGDGVRVTPRVQIREVDPKRVPQGEYTVEQMHTKEELEHIAKCVRFTQQFLREESMSRLDQEVDSDPIIKI